MSKTQIILKHKNSKIARTYKIDPDTNLFTIGSSRNVDLKIVGSDVSPIHASIEKRNDEWFINDLSSEGGLWINQESIVEKKVDGDVTIRLGQHELDLKIIPINPGYYNFNERRTVSGDIHEIVVKMNGKIHHVHHRRKDEPFIIKTGVGILKLDPPPSIAWTEKKVGEFIVRQRLIPAREYLSTQEQFSFYNMKSYHAYSIMGVLLLLLAAVFYPREPKIAAPENIEQNRYSQIIYNAKIVQEKRSQSKAIAHKKESPSQGAEGAKGDIAKSAQVKGATEKTVKAISQIKASGLSKLLGRISQRANSTGVQVVAQQGGKASNAAGLTNTSLIGNENVGAVKGTGTTYGIQGVGTEGKGGGGQGYKGIGQLAQGNIGQGSSVGMLDEEADISGGMDKDAIAEVIRKNIGQIRFCYERRLVANPSLYGKVVVLFTIQDGGTVLQPKVAQSTLSDDVVEGCILRRLASWKFPSPPAGMSVQVTYPFLFKSTQ